MVSRHSVEKFERCLEQEESVNTASESKQKLERILTSKENALEPWYFTHT